MYLTVFTPTYNRGYIIENLYRSLQRQTFHDFEWVVIDDGSTDNTRELFAAWTKEENTFPIYYQRVENGGKHRAINRGVQMAKGDLFFIVDSDDYLTDNALERVAQVEATIPTAERKTFAGVCGLRGYTVNRSVGSTFAGEYLDITTLERPKYGISGDKAEVFDTAILKKYPFPAFDGENFITESVVWDRIAADGYKLRYFNEIIYLCEYLPDGLTRNGVRHFFRSPAGYQLYHRQRIDLFPSWRGKLWHCFRYHVFRHLSHNKAGKYRGKYRLLVWLTAPLGVIGTVYYQRKARK